MTILANPLGGYPRLFLGKHLSIVNSFPFSYQRKG